MPTYDYICEDCHQRFEIFVSISQRDSLDIQCPQCHSKKVRQKFGAPALHGSSSGSGEYSASSSGSCSSCSGGSCSTCG